MNRFDWQLTHPINTLVFDCDGTLSAIEGIDELAKKSGASELVKALTETAMSRSGMSLELYEKRLELVHPTHADVLKLANQYFARRVPDIDSVFGIFRQLKKTLYIISAGLLPSVSGFGEKLHVPEQNIIAVPIEFDADGHYKDFDRASPLVTSNGKRIVINQLKTLHQDIVFVGDGLNDLVAQDLVKRFIGYGGAFYRKNIATQCQFYINTPSFTALLPLTLTLEEYTDLSSQQKELYQQGLEAILEKKVAIT